MNAEAWDQAAKQVNFNLEIDWSGLQNLVCPQARLLDFGCGYGRIGKQLIDNGFLNVVGVDSSFGMVLRGQGVCPTLPLIHSSERGLPFADDSFDAVVICAVLTTIAEKMERKRAIKEIMRVLKPGGIVHLSEFSAPEEKEFSSGFGVGMRYSRPSDYRNMFGEFVCLWDDVMDTWTIGGSPENNYRAFFKSPVNKGDHSGMW